MWSNRQDLIDGGMGLGSVVGLLAGWFGAGPFVFGASATVLCFTIICVTQRVRKPALPTTDVEQKQEPRPPSPALKARSPKADAHNMGGLVEQMLDEGRYGLLLRPQIAANLTESQLQQARAALDDEMALVPEGDVRLAQPCGDTREDDATASRGKLVYVDPLFLDRHPVTNRQYQQFVTGGGYEQMALWDPEIWAGILDFVDQTAHPGPRYWRDGMFPRGQQDHPVVGVSWYEAAAYARWLGKRSPTDPEWVKAASWPVPVAGGIPLERRFPWGDSLDPKRANLWETQIGKVVPVTEFADGVSAGGVYGLIGNVWEWTSTAYGAWDGRKLEMAVPLKSLRGGAFDTYFEVQATCQFQSGEVPVARKHNIGFRCALGLCDLAPADARPDQGDSAAEPAWVASGAAETESVV